MEPTAIEITCTDEQGGEVGVAMEDNVAENVMYVQIELFLKL